MKKYLKHVLSLMLTLAMAVTVLPFGTIASAAEDSLSSSSATGILGVAPEAGLDKYSYGSLWCVSAVEGGYTVSTNICDTDWYINFAGNSLSTDAVITEMVSNTVDGNALVSIESSSYMIVSVDADKVYSLAADEIADGAQYYIYDVGVDAYLTGTVITGVEDEKEISEDSLSITRSISEEYLEEEQEDMPSVVSEDGEADVSEVEFSYTLYHDDEAAADIEYDVFDTEGNLVQTGSTDEDGGFIIMNGYTVTFRGIDLDDETVWYASADQEEESEDETVIIAFEPSSISASCSYAKKTKKATVSILTSKDVSYVTVNGEMVTPKDVAGQYRFSKSFTKVSSGTVYTIVAYNADGIASASYTVTAE